MSYTGANNFVNVWRKVEIEPWKEWFAWYPVRVKGKRVWFKKIYRRCIWRYGGDDGKFAAWEYGTVFDVLTSKK